MSRYSPDMTIRQIYSDPLLEPVRAYLKYYPGGDALETMRPDVPLGTRKEAWAPESIIAGLETLASKMQCGLFGQYYIYEGENCDDDALKRDVNLIRLSPEKSDPSKPFILICGGGAYKWVSNLVESMPTAAHFVAAGCTVFMLTYRVSTDMAAVKALSDLASALRFIFARAGEMGLANSDYALCGFSAGANLISAFGVPSLGYARFGLKKPAAMFPIYTYIDLKHESVHSCVRDLLRPMFGENCASYEDEYNIVDKIDADYPPCYIVCGRDDMSVPAYHSEKLYELLRKAGVKARLDEGDHAPHAFGDGKGTDAEGWPERAMEFLIE